MFSSTYTALEKVFGELLDGNVFEPPFKGTELLDYHIESKEGKSKIYFLVPGIKKEQIKITVEDRLLTIEYPKKKFYESKASENTKLSFKIGSHVNTDEIVSKLEDGILVISLNSVSDKRDLKKVIPID